MIAIRNIHLAYGEQVLYDNASLQINEGDRFALVGPNGAGKSSLFKILLGENEPDKGVVQIKRGLSIGYLAQETAPATDRSVLDECLSLWEHPDGRLTAKAKSVLMGLSFKVSDFDRPVSALSGGWAMRVAMARLLVQEPDLLLLDEPTNHLDLESLLWFQDYLIGYPGTIVLISHDRSFINAICHSIVSVQERSLRVYPGDYESFVAMRAGELVRLEAAYQQQQAEIAEMEDFVARNRARASTASRAQNMLKRLERLERVEMPESVRRLTIKLPQPPRSGKDVLTLKNIDKSYGAIPVYKGLNFAMQRGMKSAFVGPNGAGKSTLLKMLAGVLPFEGGERIVGHNVNVGYHSQHRLETMDPRRTVYEEAQGAAKDLSEQSIRTVLGSFLFPGDAVYKKVQVLSGGEKSRLSLVKILLEPPNALFLDEPTTHLDITAVEALITALKAYEGTLAFISHDLFFVNALAEHVVHVDKGQVAIYPGNYELFAWRRKQAGVAVAK